MAEEGTKAAAPTALEVSTALLKHNTRSAHLFISGNGFMSKLLMRRACRASTLTYAGDEGGRS